MNKDSEQLSIEELLSNFVSMASNSTSHAPENTHDKQIILNLIDFINRQQDSIIAKDAIIEKMRNEKKSK